MTALGVEDLTSHAGLCRALASLCGGARCFCSSQCVHFMTREQLRDLVYRRFPSQLFSPAGVISRVLDERPAKPGKVGAAMTSTQTRLLNHFRAIATNELESFFAIPASEFVRNSFCDPCLTGL